jgi:alkylated DNA repair dioxygenase AlkB
MPRADLFATESLIEDPGPETDCRYLPGFIPAQNSTTLLHTLWAELPWRQLKIRLFGKEVMQPRLLCWQSDPGIDYSYSGLTLQHKPWHPKLADLRIKLHSELGLVFNSALVNAYRDGRDSMGWHSDDEPELGSEPTIISISLGAERVFRIREKGARSSRGIVLENGSLLIMSGKFQARHQHALPKSKKVDNLRINLTFRRII